MNSRWILFLVGLLACTLLVTCLRDVARAPAGTVTVECSAVGDRPLGTVTFHPVIEEGDTRWGGDSLPLEASRTATGGFAVRYPWSNEGTWSAEARHRLNVKSTTLGGVQIALDPDRSEYVVRFEEPTFLVLTTCEACRELEDRTVRVSVSDGLFGANTTTLEVSAADEVALGPVQPGRYEVALNANDGRTPEKVLEDWLNSGPTETVMVFADMDTFFEGELELRSGKQEICLCGR